MAVLKRLRVKLWNWLLDRAGLREMWEAEAKEVIIPLYARHPMYCLGGLTLVAFMVLVITGIFLGMYYSASVETAWDSIQYINHSVPYGWFIRNIHRWASIMMIITLNLHMLRVFVTGSYKKPRELTWVVGVFLLMATMGASFTGYLLPWDQRSFWAITVTANLIRSVELIPYIGHYLLPVADYIRMNFLGAPAVGPETLTRFFITHVLVMPGALSGIMVAHFYLVRKHGISPPL